MGIDLRRLGVTALVIGVLLAPRVGLARESGIQRTPDQARVLVSKDVGGVRYAITRNESDGSATGNVFSTDGGPPQFIACTSLGSDAFSCRVADACTESGRQSGIQSVPGAGGVLVSKDVGGARYAITRNADGTLTGNVFASATGAATFIYCVPAAGGAYQCSVADSCTQEPCVAQYVDLDAPITLPAMFFSVPDDCPSYGDPIQITLEKSFFVPDPEIMGMSSRQVINSNPFRSITKIPGGAAAADAVQAARTVDAASVPGDRAGCPINGFQQLDACDVVSTDEGPASVSTISFHACTAAFSAGGGFLVEDGILRETIPGRTSCILSTRQELPIGVELGEERIDFTVRSFDEEGALVLTDIENLQQLITQLDVCSGVDQSFASNRRRHLTGSIQDIVAQDGDDASLLRTYTDVAFTREYSSDCGTRTTTFQDGRIDTVDDRFDEVYTTSFNDLQYALSGPNDATMLAVDGTLDESCSGGSFGYRTLTPGSFDRGGDGCPQGGAFELSFKGAVIGEMTFSATGGVTLTPVTGPAQTFASCNDPALRLQSCAP